MPTRHLVLYLDCEPRTFSRGVLLLKAHGHAVIASMDPHVALRIIALEPVTMVIICDSLEPGVRQQTMHAMREIRPGVPIVLLAKEGAMERDAAQMQHTVIAERDEKTLMELLHKVIDAEP
ncbi:response regulator receiver protein [Candidatus Koribacter versatilis Ellin345]|uniref:Response regulator receiver protein n=1 Tax=Koribacter versatilis (strain Ellin345) TaxID=204669 RepID=Q1INR6_KORVE|nr:hypothetical protein [Candidatus Koribacter versatilis]ABF41484.1 response regulator receiver protein [Candidatus Koribacter versatilis Ellin345]